MGFCAQFIFLGGSSNHLKLDTGTNGYYLAAIMVLHKEES